MSIIKSEHKLSHNFQMVVGGAECLLSACWKTVAVRPAKAAWGLMTGRKIQNSGSFWSDFLGLD